jgi:hypothetical protein
MIMLSQGRLKELLIYDSKTGIFRWRVQRCNHFPGEIAGTLCKGYISIRIDGVRYQANRLAWLYVYGYLPENDVDHKDRVRTHNWINNLREVSRSCNMRNTGLRKDNISGVKGVGYYQRRKKWRAFVEVNGVHKSLGFYNSFEEAVYARLAGEQCLGWKGCDSCSPAYLFVKNSLQSA